MLEVGDSVVFSTLLYSADPGVDSTAVLVNPTAATLTVYQDDVSVATPTITVPPSVTGTFSYKYVAVSAGRYRGRWVFTMADGSQSVYTETYDVQPSDAGLILGLNAAKRHLNMDLSRHDSDEELLDMIVGITPMIEDLTGPIVPRTVVEIVSGKNILSLAQTPVLSITSIVPFLYYGSTYAPSQLAFTPQGTVRLNYGGTHFYGDTFTVTYVAGRKPIPPNIALGAKIILKHLWETQRGPSGSPYQGDDEPTTDTGWGYAVPNRALELLKANRLGPSVG